MASAGMLNSEGQNVDLYIPRKWYAVACAASLGVPGSLASSAPPTPLPLPLTHSNVHPSPP